MERILFIMGNMGLGGAETHVMKVYRKIDKAKYQFDFVLNVPQKCYYEDEIVKLGGHLFRVTPKTDNILKNYADIKRIVKNYNYKIVFKCGEQAMSWTEMLAAKRGGARKRIMRSTNTKGGASIAYKVVHYLSRFPLNWFVTDKIAPSKDAGAWLFGKRGCKNLVVMNNGVDLDDFSYSQERKNKAREELGIPPKAIVMGHVGRFNEQKNHIFLVDIFSEIHKNNDRTYLLLIGDGPLKSTIEEKVKKQDLENYVIFAGNRSDVNELYSAMNYFVFPSLYEGLPNTLIEAQANGLKCFASLTITEEANITNNVTFITLKNVNEWVKVIQKSSDERIDPQESFKKRKYTIDSVVTKYEEIFTS